MKKSIFKITKSYIEKYSIIEEFIDKTIVLYDDRIKHIKKHKDEFTKNNLDDVIKDLPATIATPDYINVDENKKGVQIIKKVDDNVLVAIRLSNSSELKIKSLYPISNAKYERLKNGASKK